MIRFLRALGALLVLVGLSSAGFGAWLIYTATNPPPGGGSLGHVGMVIAGLLLSLSAIFLGGAAWLLIKRADQRSRLGA